MTQLAALTTKDILDRTLTYIFNVTSSGAENTALRARLLQALQELVVEMWLGKGHEWPWTMRSATLTAPSSGSTSLPVTFYEVGRSGCLMDTATQRKFMSVDQQEMNMLHATSDASRGYIYSLGPGTDKSATRTLLVTKGWDGCTTLKLVFRRIPPLCVDEASPSNDELAEIPATHQWGVLLNGMKWRGFEDLRDARWEIWHKKYMDALSQMSTDERAGPQKDTAIRPPSFSPIISNY